MLSPESKLEEISFAVTAAGMLRSTIMPVPLLSGAVDLALLEVVAVAVVVGFSNALVAVRVLFEGFAPLLLLVLLLRGVSCLLASSVILSLANRDISRFLLLTLLLLEEETSPLGQSSRVNKSAAPEFELELECVTCSLLAAVPMKSNV